MRSALGADRARCLLWRAVVWSRSQVPIEGFFPSVGASSNRQTSSAAFVSDRQLVNSPGTHSTSLNLIKILPSPIDEFKKSADPVVTRENDKYRRKEEQEMCVAPSRASRSPLIKSAACILSLFIAATLLSPFARTRQNSPLSSTKKT